MLPFHLSIFISDKTKESRCQSQRKIGSKGGMYYASILCDPLNYFLTFCFESISQYLRESRYELVPIELNCMEKNWTEGRYVFASILCYPLNYFLTFVFESISQLSQKKEMRADANRTELHEK